MGRDVAVSRKGKEPYGLWKSRLDAAEKSWQESGEGDRAELRRMVGRGLVYRDLMLRGDSASPTTIGGTASDSASGDQIEPKLSLRYVNTLRSIMGDEEPLVRFSRDWRGYEAVGYLFDRLIMRAMAKAGAPEENRDGVGNLCTDGIVSYWLTMAHDFLNPEEMAEAAKGVGQKIEEAAAGAPVEPVRGEQHPEIAGVMVEQAFSEESIKGDPSGQIGPRLIEGSREHNEAALKEERERISWRHDRQKVILRRLPYGTWALKDHRALCFRDCRWTAERIVLPIDEARAHPSLRKAFRDRLMPEKPDGDENSTGSTPNPRADSETADGYVSLWRIYDRKYSAIHIIHREIAEYGEKDERYNLIGANGRSVIPPIGEHPGFFPCTMPVPMPSTEDDIGGDVAIPLLLPGKKVELALAKVKSYYLQSVKRASAGQYVYDPRMEEGTIAAITDNVDGACHPGVGDVSPDKTIAAIQWRAPPGELWDRENNLLDQWAMDMSFPKAQLTTVPVAKTALQEEMAQAAGDLWSMEIVRKLEIAYAHQAYIISKMIQFLPPQEWDALLGAEEAKLLKETLLRFGMPDELPAVRLSSRRRDTNPIRVKQLLDLDERISAKTNAFGLPEYDTKHLLDEASRSLEVGPLVQKQYSQEVIDAVAAQMEAEQGGGQKQSGSPSAGGSAANKRQRPRNRGGRRGRAAQPNRANTSSAPRDTGPA